MYLCIFCFYENSKCSATLKYYFFSFLFAIATAVVFVTVIVPLASIYASLYSDKLEVNIAVLI